MTNGIFRNQVIVKLCIKTDKLWSSLGGTQLTALHIHVKSEQNLRHLLCVPDADDVKQKSKNQETIPNRFYPQQKTKGSFVLLHLCQVHEVKAEFTARNNIVQALLRTFKFTYHCSDSVLCRHRRLVCFNHSEQLFFSNTISQMFPLIFQK